MRLVPPAAAFAVAVCAAGPVLAQAAAQVALPQSIAAFTPDVRVLGPVDPSAIIHLQFVLRLRDQAGLEAAIAAHTVLNPAQFAAAYLPRPADHAAVLAWLSAQGLSIDATPASRMAIEASGRAALVARVLGVPFLRIERAGIAYVAAASAPAIPASLAGILLSVNGLQPQLQAHPMLVPNANVSAIPYLPADFKNAYAANGQGAGAGTTSAIVIDTLPRTSDLTLYWQRAAVSNSLANIIFITVPANTTLPAPSGEETLDTEMASGMAPSAKVRVYAAGSLADSALDSAFQRVITDQMAGIRITQLSISLGECETDISAGEAATDNQDFASMTALGATVFVSSGDTGSHECGGAANVPSFYATSPNVVAVGGTTLTLHGAVVSSETGWSGSGGGISTLFAVPAWQTSLHEARRAVPDIALDANPNTGMMVVLKGAIVEFGGTSVAAPLAAGLTALVNAKRIAAGKATLGALDSRIYPMLKTPDFRDITTGSNGGYTASIGYDLVTGIGAPLLGTLLPALVAQP